MQLCRTHLNRLTRSLSAILMVLSASLCLAPGAALSAQSNAADDLRFLAGLVERGLYTEAIPAGETFLRRHGRHADAPVARLYLGEALYSTGQRAAALPHFEALARTADFKARDTARLRFAQCALEQDRAADALLALSRIRAPELLPDATRLAARAAYLAGQTDEAKRRYEELTRSEDPKTGAEAQLGLAWIAFDAEDWNAVGQRVSRALRGALDSPRALEARQLGAEAALARNDSKAALELVQPLAETDGSIAFVRARAYALDKNFERAESVFDEALERASKPDAKSAGLVKRIDRERGILFAQTGRPELAVKALRDADEPWWLARAELDRGNPQAALRVLERSGAQNEERFAHLTGEVLTALGRTADALKAYSGSNSVEGLYAALFTAFEANQDERVEPLADNLIRQFPEDPRASEAEFLAGECAFRAGRYEQAEQRFARAVQNAPKELAERALRRQLWALSKLSQHDRILKLGRQRTADPEIALLVGLSAVATDSKAVAVRAFEAGLRADPDGPRALELSYHLGLEANDTRAIEALTRVATSKASFAPDALLELAAREEGAGRAAQARRAYQEFLQRFGQHKLANDARYGLAWSFYQADQPKQALDALRPALADRTSSFGLSAHELAFWCALRSERWDDGDSSFSVLADHADCATALDALRAFAEATIKAERVAIARKATERVIKRGGNFAIGARIERLWLELNQDDLPACEKVLRATENVNTAELAEVAYALGERYLAKENWQDAERAFARAELTDSPRQSEARFQRAYLALRKNDARGALSLLKPLLNRTADNQLSPDLDAESLALGIRAADVLKDHAEVSRLAQRFLGTHGRHAHASAVELSLARAHFASRSYERATKVLTDLLRKGPKGHVQIECQLLRGLSLLELDRRSDASAALSRVVKDAKRDDDLARARTGLARIEERSAKHEAALASYLKVSILHTHEDSVTESLLSAARLLATAGEKSAARARLSELLERYPNSPRAAEARAAISRL